MNVSSYELVCTCQAEIDVQARQRGVHSNVTGMTAHQLDDADTIFEAGGLDLVGKATQFFPSQSHIQTPSTNTASSAPWHL